MGDRGAGGGRHSERDDKFFANISARARDTELQSFPGVATWTLSLTENHIELLLSGGVYFVLQIS